MKPASCEGGVLRVAIDGPQRTLAERERSSFEPILEGAVGRSMRLEFIEPTGAEPELSISISQSTDAPARSGPDPREHPLVRRVEELFNAKILDVQDRARSAPET